MDNNQIGFDIQIHPLSTLFPFLLCFEIDVIKLKFQQIKDHATLWIDIWNVYTVTVHSRQVLEVEFNLAFSFIIILLYLA